MYWASSVTNAAIVSTLQPKPNVRRAYSPFLNDATAVAKHISGRGNDGRTEYFVTPAHDFGTLHLTAQCQTAQPDIPSLPPGKRPSRFACTRGPLASALL